MSREKEEGPHEAPPICALLDVLLKNRRDTGPVNLVWPGLYLGNASAAKDRALLRDLGVTHVVNAAHGPQRVDTGPGYYGDAGAAYLGVAYLGVAADDSRDFDIGAFFRETAEFVHAALTRNGVVLVHCARGVSRSAALVLAFLMIKRGLSLMEAVEAVRAHRNILPNVGFLHQLRDLDTALHRNPNGSAFPGNSELLLLFSHEDLKSLVFRSDSMVYGRPQSSPFRHREHSDDVSKRHASQRLTSAHVHFLSQHKQSEAKTST